MSNVSTPDPVVEVVSHLRALESRGSSALVAQLVDALVSESAGQMDAVRDAAASGDYAQLYRAAHTLQGTVAVVGAESLARACFELTKMARGEALDGVRERVAHLDAGLGVLRRALGGWTTVDHSSVRGAEPRGPAGALLGRKRVLVIDDDPGIRMITQILVEGLGHDVEAAHDGLEGIAKLDTGVDLILLDVVMPGLDGFDVCRRIRQHRAGRDVPVIMVTTLETKEHRLRAVEAGANDFIAKPVDEMELRIRATSLLQMKDAQDEVKRYQVHLEQMVEERTASLRTALEQMAAAQRVAYQAQLETVERLAMLSEYRDKVTARHLERMSEYSAVIARGLRLPDTEVELILHASRMHDVGKIAVPDSILRKPASLDPQEWTVMRQHSTIGSLILDNSTSEILQAGRVIALNHHERWDGGGYPNGLSGSDIPLWGRICAVADVFDAVTTERPYKPAFPNEEALQILRDGRGKHFDPRVVDVFFNCLEDILSVQAKYRD